MTRFERFKAFLAAWGGTWLYNAISNSLKVEIAGDGELEELRQRHGAIIYVGWHSQLLVPLWHHRFQNGYAVVSEHADGELIARILQRIGYTTIRGSTTHNARRALVNMLRAVKADNDIGITPDGPLGPRYVAQPGAVYLASRTRCPIVAMGFATRWFIQFRSWDKFRVPLPCSPGAITYKGPLHVPAELSEDDVEVWRQRMQDALMDATRLAESMVGLPPEPDVPQA
ncbi:MAG: lysophospholipid acyltransferase family protein [Candidatus Brocadiae bacterium]|nr:lysophospholipid acyltransferase family protein [Candidatus Brocadiia bacterium]